METKKLRKGDMVYTTRNIVTEGGYGQMYVACGSRGVVVSIGGDMIGVSFNGFKYGHDLCGRLPRTVGKSGVWVSEKDLHYTGENLCDNVLREAREYKDNTFCLCENIEELMTAEKYYGVPLSELQFHIDFPVYVCKKAKNKFGEYYANPDMAREHLFRFRDLTDEILSKRMSFSTDFGPNPYGVSISDLQKKAQEKVDYMVGSYTVDEYGRKHQVPLTKEQMEASFKSYPIKEMSYLQEKLREKNFEDKKENILRVAEMLDSRIKVSKIIKKKTDEELETYQDLLKHLDMAIEMKSLELLDKALDEVKAHFEKLEMDNEKAFSLLKEVVTGMKKGKEVKKQTSKKK